MATVNLNEILYEINTPLRFYDNILKKNRFRFPNKKSDPFKLLTPQHCFLPFMLATPAAYQQGIEKFELIADNGSITNLDVNLLNWIPLLGKDYYEYMGQNHGLFLSCGFYYLVVTHVDGSRYFSEDFYVTPSGYCGNFIVNGKFNEDISNWVSINPKINVAGTTVWSNGRAYFPIGAAKQLYQSVPFTGRMRITFTIEDWSGTGKATVEIGSTEIGTINGNGVYSFTGVAFSGDVISFTSDASRGFYLDDVECASISSNAMDCNIMMEWGTDGCDFGNQYYGDGFVNRFIFPTDVDLFESKWKITKQATKNGNDSDIDQFIKRQEIHHIELVVPHYVVQALIEMSIHPKKTFVSKRCFGRAEMYDVTVTPKPVLNSSMYQVDIDFSMSEVVDSGCCGELERCLEICQGAYGELVGDCVEGRHYIGANKTYDTCTDGVLVSTPCENGLLSNEEADGVNNAPYWLWNDETGEWDQAPAILNIELVSGNIYKIYALLIPNNMGQLQMSINGGSTWTNVPNGLQSSDKWIHGVELVLLENTEYLFRIHNRAGICDYQYSLNLSYTTLDNAEFQTWVADTYWAIWRRTLVDEDNPPSAILEYRILSLKCNGIEELGSVVLFTVDLSNVTYALGLDGQLHMTNLMDKINPLLPSGYECFDDMRVIQYPTGESFEFVVECTMTGGGFIVVHTYTWENTAPYVAWI